MCDCRCPYPRITMKAEMAKAREAAKVEREMENEKEKGAELMSETPECHSDAALEDLANRLSGATWGGGPKGMRSLCMRALMAISYLRAEIKRLREEARPATADPRWTLESCRWDFQGSPTNRQLAGYVLFSAPDEYEAGAHHFGHILGDEIFPDLESAKAAVERWVKEAAGQ